MSKKIRTIVARISFAVAVSIALFFLGVYVFGFYSESLSPVFDVLTIVDIIAILVYFWSEH
jgi:hypothetical protein